MWLQSDVNYTQGLIVIGIIIVNARDKSDASDKSIVTMSFRSPPSDPRQVTTKHDRSSREYATTSQRRRRYARRHIASTLVRLGRMRYNVGAVTCISRRHQVGAGMHFGMSINREFRHVCVWHKVQQFL